MNALDVVAPTRAPARPAGSDPASTEEQAAESGTFMAMLNAALQPPKPAVPAPQANGPALFGEGDAVAEETNGDANDGELDASAVVPADGAVVVDGASDVALDALVRAAVAASMPPRTPAVREPAASSRPSAAVQVAKSRPAAKSVAPPSGGTDVTPESVALAGLLQREEIAESLDAIAADNAVREEDDDKKPETPAAAFAALMHAAVAAQADATRHDAARPVSDASEAPVSGQDAPIDPALTLTASRTRDEQQAGSVAPTLAKALPKLLDALGLAPRGDGASVARDAFPNAAAPAPGTDAATARVMVTTDAAAGVDAAALAVDGVIAVRVDAAVEAPEPVDAAAASDEGASVAPTSPRVAPREAVAAPVTAQRERSPSDSRRGHEERGSGDAAPKHRAHDVGAAPPAVSWSAHAAVARGAAPAQHVEGPVVHAPNAVRVPEEPMRGAGSTSHVTVQLDGDTLGANRVRVAVRGDSVRATVFADEGKTASLAAHLPELRRALEERGFVDARVTIQADTAIDRASPLAASAVADDPRLRATGASRPERGGNEQSPRGQRQPQADPERGQQRRGEAEEENG